VEAILPVTVADVDGFRGPFKRKVEVMEDMGPPVEGGTTMAGFGRAVVARVGSLSSNYRGSGRCRWVFGRNSEVWWEDLEERWAQMLGHLARRESESMQASEMEGRRRPDTQNSRVSRGRWKEQRTRGLAEVSWG
jgi:hypothetical protein